MSNIVNVGISLDGYIADRNGGLDWLNMVPNPDNDDFGFANFMGHIDALVMGRKTLDMILSFGCEWPYSKPVFVMSSTMKDVPEAVQGKVEIMNGSLENIVKTLNTKGFKKLYIDGGKLIQSFLEKDMIDELILTTLLSCLVVVYYSGANCRNIRSSIM